MSLDIVTKLLKMHLLVVWIGVFGFGVLCAPARLVCVTLLL